MGMENGHDEERLLAERFCQVGIEDSSRLKEEDFKNDNLLRVIKAVEAAETTIKQQVCSLLLSLSLSLSMCFCLELTQFFGASKTVFFL